MGRESPQQGISPRGLLLCSLEAMIQVEQFEGNHLLTNEANQFCLFLRGDKATAYAEERRGWDEAFALELVSNGGSRNGMPQLIDSHRPCSR